MNPLIRKTLFGRSVTALAVLSALCGGLIYGVPVAQAADQAAHQTVDQAGSEKDADKGLSISYDDDGGHHSIKIVNNSIRIKVSGQPSAKVDHHGVLSIGGDEVKTSEAGHAALQRYYDDNMAVIDAGKKLGKEGVGFAAHVVSEVMSDLFNGDADKIHDKVEKEGKDFAHRAQGICDAMAEVRLAQAEVVKQVPQFTPYATLDAKEVDKCYKDAYQNDDADKIAANVAPVPPVPAVPVPHVTVPSGAMPALPALPAVPPVPPVPAAAVPDEDDDAPEVQAIIRRSGNAIWIKRVGEGVATVNAKGEFRVHGHVIELTDTQREYFKDYYRNGLGVIQGAAALRKQETHVIFSSVADLVAGQITDDTKGAEKKMAARGLDYKQHAAIVCDALDAWRTAQNQAAQEVPEFEPYAVINSAKVEQCRDKLENKVHIQLHWDSDKKNMDDEVDDEDKDDEDDTSSQSTKPAK